jgi:hypothetical protein
MMLARVFADAAALLRRDRDLWLRLGGFYFFVPAFAILLFVPRTDVKIDPQSTDMNAVFHQWIESFYANAWWSVSFTLWQIYSVGVVLILVLDPERPSVSAAIQRALRALPGLVLAYLGASVLVGSGFCVFIIPGLYLIGRTLLTQPILIAEPSIGPLGAVVASIQRSHRRGWMFFFVFISALLVQFMAASVIAQFADLAGEAASKPVQFVFSALEAAVFAAVALAQALLQAAAYRELGRPSKGI